MSHSYKKTPIHGITTCHSDKPYKVAANRKLRRKVNEALANGEHEVLPTLREVSNAWSFGKDGKMWWTQAQFGVEMFNKYMRK